MVDTAKTLWKQKGEFAGDVSTFEIIFLTLRMFVSKPCMQN
jgi:hypothetical protein